MSRHSPWVEAYYHQGDQPRAAKGCGEGVAAMHKERLFQTEADNSKPDITDILELVTEGPKRNEAAEQVKLSRAWAWIKEALEPSKCDKHSAWSDPVHDHEVSVELSEDSTWDDLGMSSSFCADDVKSPGADQHTVLELPTHSPCDIDALCEQPSFGCLSEIDNSIAHLTFALRNNNNNKTMMVVAHGSDEAGEAIPLPPPRKTAAATTRSTSSRAAPLGSGCQSGSARVSPLSSAPTASRHPSSSPPWHLAGLQANASPANEGSSPTFNVPTTSLPNFSLPITVPPSLSSPSRLPATRPGPAAHSPLQPPSLGTCCTSGSSRMRGAGQTEAVAKHQHQQNDVRSTTATSQCSSPSPAPSLDLPSLAPSPLAPSLLSASPKAIGVLHRAPAACLSAHLSLHSAKTEASTAQGAKVDALKSGAHRVKRLGGNSPQRLGGVSHSNSCGAPWGSPHKHVAAASSSKTESLGGSPANGHGLRMSPCKGGKGAAAASIVSANADAGGDAGAVAVGGRLRRVDSSKTPHKLREEGGISGGGTKGGGGRGGVERVIAKDHISQTSNCRFINQQSRGDGLVFRQYPQPTALSFVADDEEEEEEGQSMQVRGGFIIPNLQASYAASPAASPPIPPRREDSLLGARDRSGVGGLDEDREWKLSCSPLPRKEEEEEGDGGCWEEAEHEHEAACERGERGERDMCEGAVQEGASGSRDMGTGKEAEEGVDWERDERNWDEIWKQTLAARFAADEGRQGVKGTEGWTPGKIVAVVNDDDEDECFAQLYA